MAKFDEYGDTSYQGHWVIMMLSGCVLPVSFPYHARAYAKISRLTVSAALLSFEEMLLTFYLWLAWFALRSFTQNSQGPDDPFRLLRESYVFEAKNYHEPYMSKRNLTDFVMDWYDDILEDVRLHSLLGVLRCILKLSARDSMMAPQMKLCSIHYHLILSNSTTSDGLSPAIRQKVGSGLRIWHSG